jgi:hypothetical protein
MQNCLTLDEEVRPNFAKTQEELAAFLEKNSGDILNIIFYESTQIDFYYFHHFSAEYGYLQLNEYK